MKGEANKRIRRVSLQGSQRDWEEGREIGDRETRDADSLLERMGLGAGTGTTGTVGTAAVMQELSRGCSRNAEARGCSRRVGLRQEDALKMVILSQRMLQNCHAKAGGCSRHAGAEAGGCSRNGGTEAGDDVVLQNHSGCPVPTVTCSAGQAQPVSSPFRPAQDGWGQAGDTPESLHTHGQRPAPPGAPRPPS